MINFIIDEKKEAVCIEVELEGDTQTYALSFLRSAAAAAINRRKGTI